MPSPSLSPRINGSSCLLIGVSAWRNGQNGLYAEGFDSNVCTIIGFDGSENGEWGVYGWLGNTYIAPHVGGNRQGGYRIGNISRNNIFLGAYAETDSGIGLQFDAGGAGGNLFIASAMANAIVDSTSRVAAFPNLVLINGRLRLTKPPTSRRFACWETDGSLSLSITPCSSPAASTPEQFEAPASLPIPASPAE